jgi:glycosyltransferase involved in cell wall biosynthesis
MRLSVVIPVYNDAPSLARCLKALASGDRLADEIIVVDDHSTDGSADVAARHGAQVLTGAGGPDGPAAARNRGAAAASGDILVFVDADVALHPDVLSRIERGFADRPDRAALFGSYDETPADRGMVSMYKNLLHHYTHQTSRPEASTFWAGCGAIRRAVFLACGGFDEGYRRPAIEDIELGTRITRQGHRIHSCPEIQATHLKHWGFVDLVMSDIFRRAIPWSLLIHREGAIPDDLNLGRASRFSALAAWVALACSSVAVTWPWALAGAAVALTTIVACNAGLFHLLARRGGPGLLAAGLGLHSLYLLYSSAAFAMIVGPGWLVHQFARPSPVRPPAELGEEEI